MRHNRPRIRRVGAGDETQIDLVVSFFAALLIILLTLTVGGAVERGETGARYRPLDPPTEAFPARAACALNPLKTTYLLRHGAVWRLDMAQLAALWAAGDGRRADRRYEAADADLTLRRPTGAAPGAYRVKLTWRGEAAPPLLARVGALEEFFTEDAPALAFPATLFIWPDMRAQGYRLVDDLQGRGARPEVFEGRRVDLVWSRGSFREESVFRC